MDWCMSRLIARNETLAIEPRTWSVGKPPPISQFDVKQMKLANILKLTSLMLSKISSHLPAHSRYLPLRYKLLISLIVSLPSGPPIGDSIVGFVARRSLTLCGDLAGMVGGGNTGDSGVLGGVRGRSYGV